MNMSLAKAEPQRVFEQAVRKALSEQINPDVPEAWQHMRQQAIARFEEMGLPGNRQEAWKHVELRPLIDTAFQLAADPVLTMDGPCGAWAMTLSEAWRDPEISTRLSKVLDPAEISDALALVNLALASHGWVVHVPKSTSLDELIRLQHHLPLLIQQATTTQSLLVILMDAGAKASIAIESHSAPGAHSARLAQLGIMVDLMPNACLKVLHVQDEASDVYHFDHTFLKLATGAEVHWTTVAFGGLASRHAIVASLNGPLATAHLNGLSILKDASQVFHHTEVLHQVHDTRSHQLYKGIVNNASKVEFDGTIIVSPNAQKTSAEQQNKHLVLSRDATVWSRPQLQIDADDVKCTHGASVGQLSEDELFYLASRGISRPQAQQMLTLGFATEVTSALLEPMQTILQDRLLVQLSA